MHSTSRRPRPPSSSARVRFDGDGSSKGGDGSTDGSSEDVRRVSLRNRQTFRNFAQTLISAGEKQTHAQARAGPGPLCPWHVHASPCVLVTTTHSRMLPCALGRNRLLSRARHGQMLGMAGWLACSFATLGP